MAEEINPKNERTAADQQPEHDSEARGESAAAPDETVQSVGTQGELEQLQQRLEELQKIADGFKDQLLRKAAEFENYKRRTETDYLNVIRNASEGLILSMIPILDDFVRSLTLGKEQRDYEAFYRGIELIYSKFAKVLESQGLLPFESLGKPFNVEYHDALLQIPRDDVPPHTVIEEVERGYKLNDKVLRHARVIVSTGAETPAPEAGQRGNVPGTEVEGQ